MNSRYGSMGRWGLLGVAIALGACIGGNGNNQGTGGGSHSGGQNTSGGSILSTGGVRVPSIGGNTAGGTARSGGASTSGGSVIATGGVRVPAAGGSTAGVNASGGSIIASGGETGGAMTAPVHFADLDPSAQGSALNEREVMALCREFDARVGLVDDLESACQLESWIYSASEDECVQMRELCIEAAYTLQGFELPLPCAAAPMKLAECDSTVKQLVDCAQEDAAFVAARSCGEDQLFDSAPPCLAEVSQACPSLYRDNSQTGTGGRLSTGGSLATGGFMAAPTSECSGVSTSCYSLFNSLSCTSQQGCYWSSSSGDCTGISTSCYSLYSSYGCSSQQGCYWSIN